MAETPATASSDLRTVARSVTTSSRRLALALGLVVLAALAPLVQEANAQTGSRFGFMGAVVDDGTIRLDGHRDFLGADDFVERGDHVYSDKAPGQMVLGLPFYASARLVGAEPASVPRYVGNLGVWWITLWTSVVPAAALCAAMFAAARRRHPETAASAALALSVGTILLLLGGHMYGHLLSALLGFSAWAVADGRGGDEPPDARRLLVVGALLGAGVATEYSLAIVAIGVVGWIIWRGGARRLAWLAAGGLPFALLVGLYHQAAYGSALQTGYGLKPTLNGTTVVGGPDAWTGIQALVGSRGLLLLTPIVLVAVLGCLEQLRAGGRDRATAVLALGLMAAFTVLQSGWPNPWGGETPGPRYFAPALPFLVLPLAHMWRKHGRACVVATAIGTSIMAAGLLTDALVGSGGGVVRTYLDRLASGPFVPTIFTPLFGWFGWVLYLGLLAAAIANLVHARRSYLASLPPCSEALPG